MTNTVPAPTCLLVSASFFSLCRASKYLSGFDYNYSRGRNGIAFKVRLRSSRQVAIGFRWTGVPQDKKYDVSTIWASVWRFFFWPNITCAVLWGLFLWGISATVQVTPGTDRDTRNVCPDICVTYRFGIGAPVVAQLYNATAPASKLKFLFSSAFSQVLFESSLTVSQIADRIMPAQMPSRKRCGVQ